MEVTVSLGDNNTEKERSSKDYMKMVGLLLLLLDYSVLMLIMFSTAVWKLLSLTQGIVKLFLKMIAPLEDYNIKD